MSFLPTRFIVLLYSISASVSIRSRSGTHVLGCNARAVAYKLVTVISMSFVIAIAYFHTTNRNLTWLAELELIWTKTSRESYETSLVLVASFETKRSRSPERSKPTALACRIAVIWTRNFALIDLWTMKLLSYWHASLLSTIRWWRWAERWGLSRYAFFRSK